MNSNLRNDIRERVGLTLAPLTIHQYHRMILNGILRDGEPVELIEGVLVYKDRRDCIDNIDTPLRERILPHGARHSSVVGQLGELLTIECVPLGCHPRIQLPLPLPPFDEPEPDLCIVRGRARDYVERSPNRDDVLVVIEVAGSSLETDQRMKQRLYAARNLPLYAIVDLQDHVVVVYSCPIPEERRYHQQLRYRRGENVEFNLSELGQVSLAIDDLFGTGLATKGSVWR